MRSRSLLPVAIVGSAALALVLVSPAYAATSTWSIANTSWWNDSNSWAGGAIPGAGDDVLFDGGALSYYSQGDQTYGTFTFAQTHRIQGAGGNISLTGGVAVQAGVDARIGVELFPVGDQTWTVASTGMLTTEAWVTLDPISTLTLDIDGTLNVAGNLRADAACIIKTGPGTLVFSNNPGGASGPCGANPAGLLVEEGLVSITPGSNLGGKPFVVAGGTFTGGTTANPSIVNQLSLVSGGTVAPGWGSDMIGTIQLWGTSAWTGGVYLADIDPVNLVADLIEGVNQPIIIGGSMLSPLIPAGLPDPTSDVSVVVVSSNISVSGAFNSPAGVALADGDEFEANGHLFRYGQTANEVTVTWLGAAPTPAPETPAPTPPTKVSTAVAG